ncbi:hypothetical protein [Lactovum odontotermitis]
MGEIVKILNDNNVVFDRGLSDVEIEQLEKLYCITFPPELKELYKEVLPISKGFYNWREALENKNMKKFKDILGAPIEEIRNNIDEIDWNDSWGEKPENEKDKEKLILEKLMAAPELIPVFGHRYMVSTSKSSYPVLSISGWDIIYYGNNLETYFKIEFKILNWKDMDFENIKSVEFWSDIM